MCLNLSYDNQKSHKATEPIKCYKILVEESENILIADASHNGKQCSCVVHGRETEGILIEFEERWYLCTNKFDGIPIPDKYKKGYLCSWIFDENVTSVVINDEELVKIKTDQFRTPYQDAEVEIGKQYDSELIKSHLEIEEGLHSFKNLEDAKSFSIYVGNPVIALCEIPAGATYYEGTFQNLSGYASDKLTYVRIIE